MPTTSSAEDLTLQARFVFVGSVIQLKAATMLQVPVSDSTAIVRVVKVLRAPEALSNWANQQITVQLSVKTNVQEGQQYVFYTNGWLYGDSIAVNALEERPVTKEFLDRQVSDPVQALADQELEAHIAEADLIVVGKVIATRLPAAALEETDASGNPVPVTRKRPRRHEAVIESESVEKGSYAGKQVVVLFHTSTDIAWHKSPKFKPGDEGVFLLHKIDEQGTEATYSCPHAMDFQPWSKLDQIRSYIRSSTNP